MHQGEAARRETRATAAKAISKYAEDSGSDDSDSAASASDELDLYLTVQRGKRPIGVNLSASNLVTEVTPGTPADGVLHVGDRLVEIDGVPLRGRRLVGVGERGDDVAPLLGRLEAAAHDRVARHRALVREVLAQVRGPAGKPLAPAAEPRGRDLPRKPKGYPGNSKQFKRKSKDFQLFTRISILFATMPILFTRNSVPFTRISIRFTWISISFTRISIRFTRISLLFIMISILSNHSVYFYVLQII